MTSAFSKHQDLVLLALRLIVAAVFATAAYVKWVMWFGPTAPEGMTANMFLLTKFLAVVETLGVVAILFGFLTRWAALGLAAIMVGAILVLQFQMGVGFSTPTGPGWSFPLMVLGGCLVLTAFGAGRFGLDRGK